VTITVQSESASEAKVSWRLPKSCARSSWSAHKRIWQQKLACLTFVEAGMRAGAQLLLRTVSSRLPARHGPVAWTGWAAILLSRESWTFTSTLAKHATTAYQAHVSFLEMAWIGGSSRYRSHRGHVYFLTPEQRHDTNFEPLYLCHIVHHHSLRNRARMCSNYQYFFVLCGVYINKPNVRAAPGMNPSMPIKARSP
jgi:hypothetical protein